MIYYLMIIKQPWFMHKHATLKRFKEQVIQCRATKCWRCPQVKPNLHKLKTVLCGQSIIEVAFKWTIFQNRLYLIITWLVTVNWYIHLQGLGLIQSADHLANEINQGHCYVKRENNLEKLKWCNAKKNKQRRPDNSLQIFLMTALWISGCIRQLYLLQI